MSHPVKKFTTFDEAFYFAKERYEKHLEATLQTPLGISLIANLFCTVKLLPELNCPNAEKYQLDLGVFNQKPWEIKKYPCENADLLMNQFNDLRLNVLQRAMPHNPSKLHKIQKQYVDLANDYRESILENKKEAVYKLGY